MKRLVSIFIFSCVALLAFAQEKIVSDTISKPLFSKEGLLFEQPFILDNSLSFGKLSLTDNSIFNQPLIPNYNTILNLKKPLSLIQSTSKTDFDMRLGYSPFFTVGKIYNQATYRVNDRFSFGGNSFGAQSVFDQPILNPAIQNMSTKGASMFMQYKVSKNFKIETRVSVTNH
jgi:hypothetical protein